MPLYEYACTRCGRTMEILVSPGEDDQPRCPHCGSRELDKLLSAPSSMSGVRKNRLPGPSDTGCCGKSPSEATCPGPGSCCGRIK